MTPKELLKEPGVAGCADLAIDLIREVAALKAAHAPLLEALSMVAAQNDLEGVPDEEVAHEAVCRLVTVEMIAREAIRQYEDRFYPAPEAEPALQEDASSEMDCTNMLLLCGELGGIQPNETPARYLRRLIDELILLREDGQRD